MSEYRGSLQPLDGWNRSGAISVDVVVVSFCARWCGTCRAFRPVMERLAAEHPELAFIWADIEDDASLVGDLEVENFPTLAIYFDGKPMYFGVVLPQAAVVEQLLRTIRVATGPLTAIPAEVRALAAALRLG